MRRKALIGLAIFAVVAVLGPRPKVESPRALAPLPPDLDGYLVERERAIQPTLGSEKGVVWAAKRDEKTPLALVYLHGFSATRREISPVVEDAAKELHANAYFTRLKGHGLVGEEMAKATAQDWLEDSVEAMAIGKRIGERVVIIGTSTGGTLATWLALHADPNALVLISPNFGPKAPGAGALTMPWLSVIVPRVIGRNVWKPLNDQQARFWTTSYPAQALVPMMALVDNVVDSNIEGITIPTLFMYSDTDDVVDARATSRVYARFKTKERFTPSIPPGEPSHVFTGDIVGPARTAIATKEIVEFIRRLASQ